MLVRWANIGASHFLQESVSKQAEETFQKSSKFYINRTVIDDVRQPINQLPSPDKYRFNICYVSCVTTVGKMIFRLNIYIQLGTGTMCFPFVLAIGFIHEYLFVIFIVNTLTGAPGPAHKYLDIGLVSLLLTACWNS